LILDTLYLNNNLYQIRILNISLALNNYLVPASLLEKIYS